MHSTIHRCCKVVTAKASRRVGRSGGLPEDRTVTGCAWTRRSDRYSKGMVTPFDFSSSRARVGICPCASSVVTTSMSGRVVAMMSGE